MEGFEFHRLEKADFGLGVLIPVHQGAFGNVKVGGDARQAPALGAQFDESAFGVGCVHK